MADHDPDGMEETFESTVRVALTAAGLMAERVARARQQAAHDAQAASEQEARELQTRIDAERSAARASLRPMLEQDAWWDSASAEQIGDNWQTANAWRDIDPDAQAAADRIRDELRGRYAIDVDSLDADPAAVQDALERRERALRLSVEARERAAEERATAQLLLRDADRADLEQDPVAGAVDRERADEHYDTAERREDLAASLDGLGVDEETREARLLADKNQGRPAHEAVAEAPQRPPVARRSRGQAGKGRSQAPRRSDRGR